MSINLAVVTRNLFPTPVAAVLTPDADARNAELRTLILDRRRTARSMAASNAGGWHSDRDLLAWGGVRAAEVIEMARAVATQLTRDRDGREVRPTWVVSAWANVNGPGDSNFCHYHPGSFWSGAYYVDDGGVLDDPSLGGGFEMLDPRGTAPAMLAPTLAFAGEGGLAAGAHFDRVQPAGLTSAAGANALTKTAAPSASEHKVNSRLILVSLSVWNGAFRVMLVATCVIAEEKPVPAAQTVRRSHGSAARAHDGQPGKRPLEMVGVVAEVDAIAAGSCAGHQCVKFAQ